MGAAGKGDIPTAMAAILFAIWFELLAIKWRLEAMR